MLLLPLWTWLHKIDWLFIGPHWLLLNKHQKKCVIYYFAKCILFIAQQNTNGSSCTSPLIADLTIGRKAVIIDENTRWAMHWIKVLRSPLKSHLQFSQSQLATTRTGLNFHCFPVPMRSAPLHTHSKHMAAAQLKVSESVWRADQYVSHISGGGMNVWIAHEPHTSGQK